MPRVPPPPGKPIQPIDTAASPTTEAEATWRGEHEGGDLAVLRQNTVTQFFQREEVSSALKSVACRETLCRLILDNSVVTTDDRARSSALRLARNSTVIQNAPDELVALVPFTTIETLAP